MVLCCLCGTEIEPNKSNMCAACLRSQVDITKDIGREGVVYFCKSCGKYSIDSMKYLVAELESPELLALCLKGIQGLGKGKSSQAKLVDASWVWTEPHSLRLKVKLDLEKELSEMNNVLVQQSVVTDFIIKTMMCGDCQKETTNQQWKTLIQLRQYANHKKTLLSLEQQLRTNPIMKQVIDIIQAKNGLDFYFADRPEANKFYEAVLQLVPSRKKSDTKSLKGGDYKSNIYRYEYTIVVEVSPVCRLDLLILPAKTNSSLFAGKTSVVLCHKVTKSLHFVDPFTGVIAITADSSIFDMQSLLTAKELTQFVVLDVNEEAAQNRTEETSEVGDVEVARISDFGRNDERFVVRSHLARFLQTGDTVLGYDLTNRNFADDLLKDLRGKELPSVVLVKKDKAYAP